MVWPEARLCQRNISRRCWFRLLMAYLHFDDEDEPQMAQKSAGLIHEHYVTLADGSRRAWGPGNHPVTICTVAVFRDSCAWA